MTELFESGDQIVMEQAKVCEWFCVRVTGFFLRNFQEQRQLRPNMGEQVQALLTGVLSTPKILSRY